MTILQDERDASREKATAVAEMILGTLAEGSVVVVDAPRAVAALTRIMIDAKILGAQHTARAIIASIEGSARPPTAAEICAWVRDAYEVTT